jgi:hypothetical protein
MNCRRHRLASLPITLALLATAAAAHASDVPYDCTTNGAANWLVVANGPVTAPCPGTLGGDCTEMHYTITPQKGRSADHVAILAEHDLSVVVPDARNVSAPCIGDSVTSIGIRDCSTQAVRMNNNADTGAFDLVVQGSAAAVGKSIVIKKGNVVEACRIASLGSPTVSCNPKAQQATKETFKFEECEIEIELDPCTGEPGDATVVSGDCAIDSGPVETLQLVINGTTQNVTVGQGWISSGDSSCTTTLFGGRKYTTCTCKDASDCSVKNSDGHFICGSPCPR